MSIKSIGYSCIDTHTSEGIYQAAHVDTILVSTRAFIATRRVDDALAIWRVGQHRSDQCLT